MLLNLAISRYAFYWSFPEIVADYMSLFKESGLQIKWHDITPSSIVYKGDLYVDAMKNGLTDLYHAGEWACISRVINSGIGWVVAKSLPSEGTLNSTFSLFVRPDSDVKEPRMLAGRKIAIDLGTGSYYTALQDLESFVSKDKIKFVQIGDPHKRLIALVRGEVDCASLLGPWSELAKVMGMKCLLSTRRKNPTVIVVRRDLEPSTINAFFKAVNHAIELINNEPDRFKKIYFEKVRIILLEMPDEIRSYEDELLKVIKVPRWMKWEPYTKEDFDIAYRWMVERSLVDRGFTYIDVMPKETSIYFR